MEKIDLIRNLVRPFISVFMVLTFVCLAILGKIDAREVATIVGMIIAFHFGERAATKRQIKPPSPPE